MNSINKYIHKNLSSIFAKKITDKEMMNVKELHSEGDVNWISERKEWTESLSKEAQNMLNEDQQHFITQSLSTPCLNNVMKAEGIKIVDSDGRSFYDFHGNSVHQLGYNNKYITDRVKQQMDRLVFSPRRYANERATACAKRLTEVAPGDLNKLLFTTSGACSNSIALKIARIATGRYKTISMYDSFHGANLDTIAVGGESLFRSEIGPLLPGTILVPPIDTYRGYMSINKYSNCEEILLDQISYILEKEGDIAALLAEPIRSTTIHIPSFDFWKQVKHICEKHGTLLIFDEIPTCMGRTGTLFATEHFGIAPDILVVGKGLGAGIIPFSAVLVNERLDIAPHKALGHYTFEKNPIAAEATLASLDYIEQNNLLAHCNQLSGYFRERLSSMQQNFEFIGDIRGIGLLWGIEIVKSRATKEADLSLTNRIFYRILRKGVSFKVSSGSILTLTPPLVITLKELTMALDLIEEAFKEEKNGR